MLCVMFNPDTPAGVGPGTATRLGRAAQEEKRSPARTTARKPNVRSSTVTIPLAAGRQQMFTCNALTRVWVFTVCSRVEQNSAAKRCNSTQRGANTESPNTWRQQRCAKQRNDVQFVRRELEIRCSVRLSYGRKFWRFSDLEFGVSRLMSDTANMIEGHTSRSLSVLSGFLSLP